jgi:hypothetical protein
MNDEAIPEDPLLAAEKLLAKARDETAHQATGWQKAHQVTDWGYQLIRRFNIERQQLGGNEQFKFADTTFANTSGVSLLTLAKDLQQPVDATVTLGTSQVLLSGLQSNIASYVSSPLDFGVKDPFQNTLVVLESQRVPIEERLPALSRRLVKFSDHFLKMIAGVQADLVNEANPLAISNAAKNLRETFTTFIHEVAPDGTVEQWPDCEVDPEKQRPTRRARLGFHAFLRLAKAHWPEKWTVQVEKRIKSLLDCFGDLNKFTHITEATADELKTARVSLDKFVSEFILYLDTAHEANEVFQDLLQGPVETELRELADGELHSWFEEGVSHAYTDDVYCEELRIDEIKEERIVFSGRCRVTGTFQHGSDGDVRRGDGLEWKGAKSFTFSGTAPAGELDALEIEPTEFLEEPV